MYLLLYRTTKRIKRKITKPKRFQTTSSDECPRKQIKRTETQSEEQKKDNVAQDLTDLHTILDDEDTYISSETSEEHADETSKDSTINPENQVLSEQALPQDNFDSTQSINVNPSRTTCNTVVNPNVSQNVPSSSTTLSYGQTQFPNVYSSNIQEQYQQENNVINYSSSTTQMPYRQELIPNTNYMSHGQSNISHIPYKTYPSEQRMTNLQEANQNSRSLISEKQIPNDNCLSSTSYIAESNSSSNCSLLTSPPQTTYMQQSFPRYTQVAM